jgi:hypothetical protein
MVIQPKLLDPDQINTDLKDWVKDLEKKEKFHCELLTHMQSTRLNKRVQLNGFSPV